MAEMTTDDRLAAVEARQQDYEMHDPDCPTRLIEKAQRYTGAYLLPQDCTCWLSENPERCALDALGRRR